MVPTRLMPSSSNPRYSALSFESCISLSAVAFDMTPSSTAPRPLGNFEMENGHLNPKKLAENCYGPLASGLGWTHPLITNAMSCP
jgi:hypothetical protein